MLKPKNNFEVLIIPCKILKVFGLAPFRITPNRVENSKLSLALSVCLLILYNVLAIVLLFVRKAVNPKHGLVDNVDLFLNEVSMSFGILFGIIFRNIVSGALA